MINETGYDNLVNMYYRTDMFKSLPFSGGWAEQPMYIENALAICGSEARKIKLENEK